MRIIKPNHKVINFACAANTYENANISIHSHLKELIMVIKKAFE
jgi:hypothetical protein